LTRPFDKHLDSDELDGLVSSHAASVTDSGRLWEETLGEAQRHVESCQHCSRNVQMHKSVQSEILNMGVLSNAAAGPDCLDGTAWLSVAGGLLPEVKTRELMKHAAQCGHCGPLLKNAAETLADEVTPSEETLLASLGSARPEWQRNMVATLRGGAKEHEQKEPWWRRTFTWPPSPAFAFAGIATVVLLTWIGLRVLRPPSAEQLLAQAYTEHRTLEVRIPGAKYAPMRVERSANGSNLDKSPSLLKAEALIGENLGRSPNDPAWLQARARADLLDGNYESAIKALQHALDLHPDSSSLLTDLGSAYFLRAESADRAIDYGNAIESLGKALGKSPDDPIALFNRALACERMFLYAQAVDDWQHYLRVEPQGEWADDARKRLAALQENLRHHERGQAEPLLSPSEVAKGGSDHALRAKIDERIEEYLHLAVVEWLPRAFQVSSSDKASMNEAQSALMTLAAITWEQHQDSWLIDLLSNARGKEFSHAILALAAAVRSNDTGDYSGGRNSAHLAAQLFRSNASLEGELRSQVEEIYSDHLLYEGARCMSLVRSLDQPLQRHKYSWLQAEVYLEESNCAGLLGDLGTTQAAIARGTNQAKIHNYQVLFLRGLGFEADAAASLGDARTSFSLASAGLALFWSAQIGLMEGYNFYTDLDTAADSMRMPNLQVALWRQATVVIDPHPDVLQRAMAHRWYGNAAYLANMPGLAAGEFGRASALFSAAPQTAATKRDRMDAEIWLAHIEVRQGDVERAASRLQQIQSLLDSAPSFAPEIGFYTTLADINIRRTDSVATESALRSAIFLAEWALHSFASETERRQWSEETQGAYRDLVAWKLRQGDANSALELWEWYRGAELRANKQSAGLPLGDLNLTAPPDAHDAPLLPTPTVVANRMASLRSETIIAYATLPDGIAIWSYDDRGVFSQWVRQPLPQVQDLAIRFHGLCSNPSSDLSTLRATARSLYDVLIAPVEERLGPGRTLVFEPDDTLAGVPFEALVDRTDHYLAERNAVSISPGLYRAMQLRPAEAITSESPVLVVSVPSPAENGWVPLADTESEAQTVAAHFHLSRWLRGSGATLNVIRQQIRGVSLFHFAGHAVASPERNGLLLDERDSRTQRARLISAENLTTTDTGTLQLVVLSACQTETGTGLEASGNESLVQGLLRAGVPHVVASRWNIDSAETAAFMKQFYATLLAGDDVPNSLRSAELAIAAHPVSQHPCYWAAFEGQGL